MPLCDRCKRDVIRMHPCFYGKYNICDDCHKEWTEIYYKWSNAKNLTDEEWLREFYRFLGIWSVS